MASHWIKVIVILFISIIYPVVSYAETHEKTLKLAILDNFNFQSNIATFYETFYVQGLEAAVLFPTEKSF